MNLFNDLFSDSKYKQGEQKIFYRHNSHVLFCWHVYKINLSICFKKYAHNPYGNLTSDV